MNTIRRWLRSGAVLTAAAVTLGGCAAEGPVKPFGLEQKIEAARTRADHEEIAAVYEQQAQRDADAAERHRGLARAYERGFVWQEPPVGSLRGIRRESRGLVAHCENLARIYERAAGESLALAKAHRNLAAETKD